MTVEYYPAPPAPGPCTVVALPDEVDLELETLVADDLEQPNYARTIDALLGGSANFAVDREAADALRRIDPFVEVRARANRAFVRRSVRHAHALGIDQFLDLGCGIPSTQSVHGFVHALNPQARITYVDLDPVVVAHARELVGDVAGVEVVRSDLRAPERVLDVAGRRTALDPARPIALLACGVLHFVDGDLADLLGRWRGALAPGSLVTATHAVLTRPPSSAAAFGRIYPRGVTAAAARDRVGLHAALGVVGPVADVVDWPHTAAGGARTMDYLGATGTV